VAEAFVDWSGWAVYGLLATAVLTGVLIVAQLAGLTRMDIPLMLGTFLFDDPDRARAAGSFIHLGMGQLFALGYAAVFALRGQANWWSGAALGLVHGFVALAVIVPLLPGVHPRMASLRAGPNQRPGLEPPGLFALNYGRQTVAATLAAHVIYGLALGLTLGPR
jgi:hypothetical protein